VGKLVVVDALGVGARTLSFAADPDRASVTQLPEAECGFGGHHRSHLTDDRAECASNNGRRH
jgi:hypothetical protein